MNSELREKILAYNKVMAERKEKAEDLEAIIQVLAKLPLLSQFKRLLSEDKIALFRKYGIEL